MSDPINVPLPPGMLGPWSRVALACQATREQPSSRSRLAADLSKALEAEREFAAKRDDQEVRASAKAGERFVAISQTYWGRVRRGYKALATVDLRAERHAELAERQRAFLDRSVELLRELTDGIDGDGAATQHAPVRASELTLLDTQGGRRALRPYQEYALQWLVNRYRRGLSAILADEMGLGKTVQTIALLAHFAESQGDWGPHLVVVPTPVVVNWCLEFKRWAPGFKVIQYIGSAAERKKLREGWTSDGAFNVCVTSFNTLVQDKPVFRSKTWGFLIVDEAHNLKNFASQKYKAMLDLHSEYRLLLTGTPLQTSVMELWSLFHFVMPRSAAFGDDALFRDFFSDPLSEMVAGNADVNTGVVSSLHTLLRPFMLRRLKADVARDLPKKREVVVRCRLSRRQRALYESYLELAETRATLEQGTFQGVVAILLSLRKVCNHPDLFAERPVLSPLVVAHAVELVLPSCCLLLAPRHPLDARPGLCRPHLAALVGGDAGALPAALGLLTSAWLAGGSVHSGDALLEALRQQRGETPLKSAAWCNGHALEAFADRRRTMDDHASQSRWQVAGRRQSIWRTHSDACAGFRRTHAAIAAVKARLSERAAVHGFGHWYDPCTLMRPRSLSERVAWNLGLLRQVVVAQPAALSPHGPRVVVTGARNAIPHYLGPLELSEFAQSHLPPTEYNRLWKDPMVTSLHPVRRLSAFIFPDPRLLVHDCGKLQILLPLLKRLRAEGHRCVIFTQFSGMLTILEKFLALYGLTYLRFDGTTKPQVRQLYVERFNRDERIFCLLLSTRAGGIGLNLVGADTVIFYDSDWNPAMDLQAQDRCHRIGQTRTVTIYRLITSGTVEASILRKARERKKLNNLVIRGGSFGKASVDATSSLRRTQIVKYLTDLDEDQISSASDDDEGGDDDDDTRAGDGRDEWLTATAAAEDAEDAAAARAAAAERTAAELAEDADADVADRDALDTGAVVSKRARPGHALRSDSTDGWGAKQGPRHEAALHSACRDPALRWAARGFAATHPSTSAHLRSGIRDALSRSVADGKKRSGAAA